MTPITIEPNSGTKMAGVKIRQSGWNVDYYEEIVFITNSSILLRDKNNGIESLCRIDCRDGWYLYEEPKAEVKKVLMSPAIFNFQGHPNLTEELFNDEETAKKNCVNFIKWPTRVVLKNLKYETADLTNSEAISADLYFEVEE